MRLRFLDCALALAGSVLLLSVAGVARADDRAIAQQLFDGGKALMAAGKVEEACRKFQGAAQLSRTPGVRLNLAYCWAKIGKTASAWAMYAEALDFAERDGNTAAADAARSGRKALAGRLCYLTVDVPERVNVTGLELVRDGQVLPRAAWNTPVPVDPGTHEVVARAPGRRRWSAQRRVSAASCRVTIVAPLLEEALGPRGPDAATEHRGSSGSGLRTLAWLSGGVGLAGLAVGSVTGIMTLGKKSTIDGHCRNLDCDAVGKAAADDARHLGLASTVAFGVGIAGVVTSAILFATSSRRASPVHDVRRSSGFFVAVDARSGSMGFRGRF